MKHNASLFLSISLQQLLFFPCYQLLSSPKLQRPQNPLSGQKNQFEVLPVEAESNLKKIDQDNRNDGIIDEVVRHFLKNDRGNVQLPPGWGKTQVSLQALRELYHIKSNNKTEEVGIVSNNNVMLAIYVTPNLKLVDQVFDSIDRFRTFENIPQKRLIVASSTGRKNESCTSDAEKIATYITSNDGGESLTTELKMLFIVSTYRSLPKVGEALDIINSQNLAKNVNSKRKNLTIDFGIFDEAHHMEGVGKLYGKGLFDHNIHIDKRLFLTATARNYVKSTKVVPIIGKLMKGDGSISLRPKGTKERKDFQNDGGEEDTPNIRDDVRSFVNETLFGPCIVRRTLRESQEQNITVPLTLCALDRKEIISVVKPEIVDIEDKVNNIRNRDRLLPFAIQAAFTKFNVSYAISFHSFTKYAYDFAEHAKEVLKDEIAVFYVDGKMSAIERDKVLKDAKKVPKSIVSNCRLLATGVDEASWDMVIFADPKNGEVISRQMVGRVTRKAKNKERGYVLVPILFELDDISSGEILEDSGGYSILISAFNAMIGLDPELRQDVVYALDETTKLGRSLLTEEIPRRIQQAFSLPSSMSYEMKNSVMNRAIIEYQTHNTWEIMFQMLLRYREREGHCNVPALYEEDEVSLGIWVGRQRRAKKDEKLDPFLQKRLDDIGFVWEISSHRWEKNYQELLEFKQREGHANPAQSYKTNGIKLGSWITTQREKMKKGDLLPDYERRLKDIGVELDPFSAKWENKYELLVKFQQREGHCDVPDEHKEDGSNLGRWLQMQRQSIKKGKLNASHQKRLLDIGVSFDIYLNMWEKNYQLLAKFKKREGHCQIRRDHKEDGTDLGVWLNNRIKEKRKGILDPTRQKQLDDLGVEWNNRSNSWEKKFALLIKFKQREGHCNVPLSFVEDGVKLGHWVTTQKQVKKKGKLDANREKRLDEIGITWVKC